MTPVIATVVCSEKHATCILLQFQHIFVARPLTVPDKGAPFLMEVVTMTTAVSRVETVVVRSPHILHTILSCCIPSATSQPSLIHGTLQLPPDQLCSLPGCTSPRNIDPSTGKQYEYCGKVHYLEHQRSLAVGGTCHCISIRFHLLLMYMQDIKTIFSEKVSGI